MNLLNPGIYIEEIPVDCHIGPEADERAILQRIVLSLFLDVDLPPAAEADEMALTVDYRAVTELANSHATKSPFRTLEGLGFSIGREILQSFKTVRRVTITVRKPGVPGRAGSVGVVLQVDPPIPKNV
jgi:7,8-dihydroneopterin aldolase/epimerase/oxygenase